MEFDEIMKKYSEAMVKYTKVMEPAFKGYIEIEQQKYSRVDNWLFAFYSLTAYLLDYVILKEKKDKDPIMFFYAKSCLSLLGIQNCLKNGLVIEGAILLRSIFELSVDLKLILEDDTESRLKLFSDYRHVDSWLLLKKKREQIQNGLINQERFDMAFNAEDVERIDSNYDLIKSNYRPNNPYHWAWSIFKSNGNDRNPNYKSICDHLGLQLDYDTIYSLMSVATHSSPLVDNFMKLNNKTSIVPVFNESINSIGGWGLDLAERVVSEVIGYLIPSEGEDIQIFTKAYVAGALKDLGFIK